MLLAIYRFVVFLAAIAVGALSAWSLWAMYSSGGAPWRQAWSEEARGVLVSESEKSDQFETTSADSVQTITDWSIDTATGARTAKTLFAIIPVFVQDEGEARLQRYGYVGTYYVVTPDRPRARRLPNGMPARPCPITYASNILVHYYDTNETMPVFEGEEVAIVQYATHYDVEPADTYLLIDYVSNDTDKDGLLTCNDAGSLAVFDISAREITPIDLDGGEPIWDARPRGEPTIVVGVGIDENGDGLHDRTRERVRVAVFNPEKKALDYLTP